MNIKSEVEKVIYDATNYHVFSLKNKTKVKLKFNPEFKIVPGIYVEVIGEFIEDKYGTTFDGNEIFLADSEDCLDLLSIAIDGIGEKKSEQILKDLGSYEPLKTDPFKIFDYFLSKSSKDLLQQIRNKRHLFVSSDKETAAKQISKEIKGIGTKKILKWMNEFEDIYPYDTQLFLDDDSIIYFLASNTALNIYEQIKNIDKLDSDYKTLLSLNIPNYSLNYLFKDFKSNSLNKIKTNPYILLDYGVNFLTCDKIALNNFGVEKDSFIRIINGLLYCIKCGEKEGNTFIDFSTGIEQTSNILQIDIDAIKNALDIELSKNYESSFIVSDNKLYRRVIFFTEKKLGNCLYRKTLNKNYVPDNIKLYLKSTKLSIEQQNAVLGILSNKISILTGGPGTGKTTTINELCNCLDKIGKKYSLCAPTGRAAKRITESTNREAQTIHRLLEYKPHGIYSSFMKNEKYPLRTDFIIVDESSMLDVYMLNSLMNAVDENTSIVFVGDVDQLPSVSMGSVFKDMNDSKKIDIFELREVFRQSLDSFIVRNAYHIKNNENLEVNDNDFKFIKINSINDVEEFLKDINCDFQILCPMKVGPLGTININKLMQNIKNNSTTKFYLNNRLFKNGDKVIQLDNDYNKDVYNGEIGNIIKINNECITVQYPYNDPAIITYKSNEIYEIELSYAISIHKSQGSEAENIILIIDGNEDFISKELIYTAVTRAKRNITILSTFELDFYSALKVNNNRMTNLNNTIK